MLLFVQRLIIRFAILLPLLWLLGCTTVDVKTRQSALNTAKNSDWILETVAPSETNGFELLSARAPVKSMSDVLTIYIEGDGHAWDRSLPSVDPTPLDPIALRLALVHGNGEVAYLGRPCQYVGVGGNAKCVPKVWTDERFSKQTLQTMQGGVNYLKKVSGAQELVLVGYSGGGALALLLAAHRADVTKVITVAGNVDITAWLDFHHLPPMNTALNPADFIAQTQSVPQFHFVGAKDRVTPSGLTLSYAQKFPKSSPIQVIEIPEYGHTCCWVEAWGALLARINKP